MKLSEIFSQLTYGELSQMSIGGADMGQINDTNYPQILAHINLGLTALYKRFNLKENTITLRLLSGVFKYALHSDYADTTTGTPLITKYIEDSIALPFVNDIHKIERVYTVNTPRYELALNDHDNQYAVMTPSSCVLRVPSGIVDPTTYIETVPDCLITTHLEVVYRANHPIITMGFSTFNPENINVELPDSHLEPLLLFVASRVHNPTGMSNEFHAGNSYYAKYEAACARLENDGLDVDQGSQAPRLKRNGWV